MCSYYTGTKTDLFDMCIKMQTFSPLDPGRPTSPAEPDTPGGPCNPCRYGASSALFTSEASAQQRLLSITYRGSGCTAVSFLSLHPISGLALQWSILTLRIQLQHCHGSMTLWAVWSQLTLGPGIPCRPWNIRTYTLSITSDTERNLVKWKWNWQWCSPLIPENRGGQVGQVGLGGLAGKSSGSKNTF